MATSAEILTAGVTPAEIKSRLRSGALIREYPGVYRIGHRAPNLDASYLAAVLACGEGALLSGRAAGHLHRLVRGAPPQPEVVSPTERRIEGIQTHRCRRMDARDRTVVRAIPVTSVARTLVDLAAVLGVDDLARACHEAGVLYATTPAQLEDVLERRPRRPGAARLRTVLRGEARVTLSALERKFLERLTAARLPLPETNRVAGGRRVDCRWPEHRLTVELDSYRYHHSRHAWEQDRRREREARTRGDEFRRFTYADVFEAPRYMFTELGRLLDPTRPANGS